MKQLGTYVDRSIKSLKAEKAVELHQLKSAWLDAVGPFLGSQTEPVKLKGHILYLIVSSPMWAQEINLQQRLIIKKLSSKLQRPPKKIVCWVGEINAKQAKPNKESQEDEAELVPWIKIPIPEGRAKGIEDTVSSIEDETLRDKMRKLLELAVQREIYLLDQGQLPCPICGNFRPSDQAYCKQCEREKDQAEARNIMRLLAHKPWLSAKEVSERLPLRDRTAFMRIRKSLLANLMLQAWQRTSGLQDETLSRSMDSDLRGLLLDITMLRCSLPAHALHPKHFYFALGKRLASGYLGQES